MGRTISRRRCGCVGWVCFFCFGLPSPLLCVCLGFFPCLLQGQLKFLVIHNGNLGSFTKLSPCLPEGRLVYLVVLNSNDINILQTSIWRRDIQLRWVKFTCCLWVDFYISISIFFVPTAMLDVSNAEPTVQCLSAILHVVFFSVFFLHCLTCFCCIFLVRKEGGGMKCVTILWTKYTKYIRHAPGVPGVPQPQPPTQQKWTFIPHYRISFSGCFRPWMMTSSVYNTQ